MKKFFSRFSSTPAQVAGASSPPSSPKEDGNVRSIAARFESLQQPLPGSPQQQRQQQQQQQQQNQTQGGSFLGPPAVTGSKSNMELLTPSSSISPALQVIGSVDPSVPPQVPAKSSQRQQQSPTTTTAHAFPPQSPPQHINVPSVIVNGGRRTKENRDASGGSSAANSSSTSAHPTKTVAFAPSPKKAVRSPLLLDSGGPSTLGQGTPPSNYTGSFNFPSSGGPPGSSNANANANGNGNGNGHGHGQGSSSGMVSDGSDTDLRSFAKPTAASLARAIRSASPALSLASGGAGSSSIYSKRISLPSRTLGDGREGSISWQSTGAKSVGGPSWSEMTEDDLVMNLGPRERTRQEVLWEIVASEERYVHELQRTRLFYLEALLHPHRFSAKELPPPPNSPPPAPSNDFLSPKLPETVPEHPVELPIAARWMTSASGAGGSGSGSGSGSGGTASSSRQAPSTAAIIQSSYRPLPGRRSSTGSPRMAPGALPPPSTSGAGANRTSSAGNPSSSNKPTRSATYDSIAQPSSSTSSSPAGTPHPLSRADDPNANRSRNKSSSNSRSKVKKSAAAAMKSKLPMFPTFPGSSQGRGAPDPLEVLLPVSLPTPVRIVLETISEGLLTEHALLSDALKNRYQEQWPLVRSLADVFLKHSFLLKHYAVYVCHLERALEYLEEAALMERAMRGKRIRKEKMTQTVAVGRAVAALEAIAAERGEPGLALFISKPFQRLLKYPLLFQNLLFHTDPSTYEFESTVAMVVEVERIVRSIEDEKVSAEERDRSRDAFARIDGITDKAVLKPKPDRTLIEEKPLYDEGPRRALSESRTENVSQTEAQTSELTSGPRASVETRSHLSAAHASGAAGGAADGGPQSSLRAMLKSKRSFRRLSDFLHTGPGGGENEKGGDASGSSSGNAQTKAPNLGSKRDLWVVRFSDVELRCQRTGTTTLPMVSSAALRPEGHGPYGANGSTGPYTEDEVPDFASRSQYSKERLRALRNTTLRAKTRNIYKFIAVQSWKTAAPSAAAAAMAARRAEGLAKAIQEVEVEEDESEDEEDGGDGEDDDDEDGPTESDSSADEDGFGPAGSNPNPDRFVREAKLSFSYWGDDRVEPRPSATYSSTSTKSPHMSSVAAFRAMQSAAAGSNNATSSSTTNDANGGLSSSVGGGSGAPLGGLTHLSASGSTPNLRSLSPSKRQAADNVVAGSHATPRVQKFGNRLRTAPPHPAHPHAESAPSSSHGHGHGHHESSSGSGAAAGEGRASSSGRISGTHHAQFAPASAGGAAAGGAGAPRASMVGGASLKAGRASNGGASTTSYR
ncbi:hypothetical protein OC842_001143 [Tilletia horrida]|uniref:DH domain-containing protein n=1 Tax=Tilletia horrida TaxID=155126 RepID=A0AAN6GFL9_9BASI|nr:hypothetical protein OC842_001143 [Tilletia horrida]